MTVAEAALRLGVSPGTVRRWLRAGAPQARRGRRGRGGQALLDPHAIAAWRSRGAEPRAAERDALRVFAAEVPELVADALWSVFIESSGPHKRALAGELAGTWYSTTSALLDRLRAECPDIAGVEALPEKIAHLRSIFRDFGTLPHNPRSAGQMRRRA